MVPNLPTIMSSRSLACGRRRVQMSMVKRVLLLLKMEASELIRAASITASIRPLRPAGQSYNKARQGKGFHITAGQNRHNRR